MMRRKDGSQIKPVRPPLVRRTAGWLTAVAALLLALALLVTVGVILVAPVNLDGQTPNNTLLLLAADQQQAEQYSLLATGLGRAGFSTVTTSPENLQASIDRNDTGQGVWLAVTGRAAADIWRQTGQLEGVNGLLLLMPQGMEQLTATEIENRPADLTIAIFTGPDPAAGAGSIRGFYEQLTGEDTALFPAFQKNAAGPLQYASSDGQTWLYLYPDLLPGLSLLPLRALPDATGWLADWASAIDGQAGDAATAAPRLLIGLLFALLIAGLLLLAVALSLNLALTGHLNQASSDGADKVAAIVLWLPAAVLAAALGYLTAILTGNPGWLLIMALLLPGCRGWLRLALRLIRGQSIVGILDSDQPANLRRLPRWTGGLITLLTLLGAVAWIALAFGTLQPYGWSWILLPVLIAVTLPAGLSGQTWQHLPYLVLPIGALIGLGWSGLLAGLLLLIVHLWASGLGRAMTGFSRQPLLGSLIQAIAWATALLLPPIVQGLSWTI